jgi:uncharacterized protein YcbK (DUF882 family)
MRCLEINYLARLCVVILACAGVAHADSKPRRVALFSGHNAAKSRLRTEPLAKPSGTVWLSAENLAEQVKVDIYKPDGSFDEAALAKLDEVFRCVKTGEVRAVRRELYEQLSRIYDHFGGKRVVLVSGFRFGDRTSSRHYHASAMDIRIPGVSINAMYRYAESLDAGGMGIGLYPTSGFIHVDFRAPGEPSFRWTDYSGQDSKPAIAPVRRTQPARRPTS